MRVIKNPEPGKWYDMDCRPEIRKGSSCCIVVLRAMPRTQTNPVKKASP